MQEACRSAVRIALRGRLLEEQSLITVDLWREFIEMIRKDPDAIPAFKAKS